MHAIVLVVGLVLAGGPHSPAGAQVRRLVLDQRQGRSLELVRSAPAETTPPIEGTLELVEAGRRRKVAEHVGAAVMVPGGGFLVVKRGELLRLDASGRATATLARGLAPELEIDPVGARVAVVRPLAQGGSAIEVVELEGEPRSTVVVAGGGYNNLPSFAPDGASLLYVSTRTGVSSVFRVGLDGAADRQLTNRGLKAAAGPQFVPPPERGALRRFDAGRLTWGAEGARFFLDLATEASGRLEGGAR